ncbi:MAG: HPF/RaiA family ribosome-associated protein [Acidobacteriota bacterium]|jgi:ribosome-associated translation inhibitor RaiA/cold shock CspA family protein
MNIPLQITFRNMNHSEAVDAYIREEVAKLEEFFDQIIGCHVVVEIPHQHHDRGNPFHIRINLEVPGSDLVVNHQPNLHGHGVDVGEERHFKELELEGRQKDAYVAMSDAFKTARRQLQDYVRRHRDEIKVHQETPEARVLRLFNKEGYGFLQTLDGREIYFHRHSVLNDGFDQLDIGTMVLYAEEHGEMGPQASTVKLAGH